MSATELASTAKLRPRALAFPAPTGSWGLRALLVGLDGLALAVAWTAAFLVLDTPSPAAQVTASAVVLLSFGGLVLFRAFGLYRTHVCALRTVEMTRLSRAAAVLGAGALVLGALSGREIGLGEAALGAAIALVLAAILRSGYRSWLAGRRRDGDFCRPVLLVGANDEARELADLLETHPELGFVAVGVVGERTDAGKAGLNREWRGDFDDAVTVLQETGCTGAIVCATALEPSALNSVVHALLDAGAHVQLSSGLRGVQVQRLRPMPLAYEPLFYVEPVSLAHWQLVTKRVMDIVLAVLMLILAAPVLAVAAICIKAGERGPAIFRQTRIGRYGQPFTVYKLRTMRVGAADEHELLNDLNVREGPLFKAPVDPRVTRLGKALRATGIDELPQLWNVLNGTMSLVGPRPALPQEVAQFDDELRTRDSVRPGVTGLWQLEGRDNPSFSAYRRFDLFYLENWSVTLDLVILLGTVEATIARLFRAMRDPGKDIQLAAVDVRPAGSTTEWSAAETATPVTIRS
jgi:exopolysaccharide biosynthesis polyprenyl glycosylphosphotransferase